MLEISTPIQSISFFSLDQTMPSFRFSYGRHQEFTTKRMRAIAAIQYKPTRHPIDVDSNQPPTSMPIANPKGDPNPRNPKAMFLALPPGNAVLSMLTEVGKHMEMPIPWKARNMIN